MKRVFAFLQVLCLILGFAACGSNTQPAESTQQPTVSEPEATQKAEPKTTPEADSEMTPEAESETTLEAESEMTPEAETETTPEAENTSLAAGDSGVGPGTLDLPICNIDVPEGLEYHVYDWYFDEVSNTGTIALGFNLTDGSSDGISIKFTTGRVASNYEEAIQASIELQNLDTYEDGKFEMGTENTYGPLTYQAYHTSTEFGEADYLISYMDFNGSSVSVEVGDASASGIISDSLITGMLASITLK